MWRHGTKSCHGKAFNFLGDLLAGTINLSFGLGSKNDIYFLVQELFDVNCVKLEKQDLYSKSSIQFSGFSTMQRVLPVSFFSFCLFFHYSLRMSLIFTDKKCIYSKKSKRGNLLFVCSNYAATKFKGKPNNVFSVNFHWNKNLCHDKFCFRSIQDSLQS